MSGVLLGWSGAAIAAGLFAYWSRLMNRVAVPEKRGGYLAAMGLAVVLGVAALVQGAGWIGGIPAVFAILAGGMFLALRLQSSQAATTPAVSVGERILDFSAADENGEPFALSSLAGKPYLLKFFRGHW
jgi:hypothetical protein